MTTTTSNTDFEDRDQEFRVAIRLASALMSIDACERDNAAPAVSAMIVTLACLVLSARGHTVSEATIVTKNRAIAALRAALDATIPLADPEAN